MKLGKLVNSQQSFLNLSQVKNGSLAIKLLSIKRKILPKIEDFNNLKNQKIKEYAPDGNLSSETNPKGFMEASKYIEDMMNSETDVDWIPINIKELSDVEVSLSDIESLLNANIIEE